jgi:hypothetical protein
MYQTSFGTNLLVSSILVSMPEQHQSEGKYSSTLDGAEQQSSHFNYFIPEKNAHKRQSVGGWMGPLANVEKR